MSRPIRAKVSVVDASVLPEPFRPAWWLPDRHRQTVAARYLRRRSGVALRRERIATPDGDFLDLDWTTPRDDHRPLVVVLHGLEGSARSGYALELYRQVAAAGADAVGLNFRSCSGELNRAPRLYHSGETGDLELVLGLLAERLPERTLAAVGVSLGGNVLLKHLGERGAATPLACAASVSVPFDLAAGACFMERGFARIYVTVLLRSLKRKLRARAAELGGLVDLPRALSARTFWEFDDAATAPLHGFGSAADYYARSSSGPLLERIRIPTLLLQSRDDPFVPAAAIPEAAVASSRWLHSGVVDAGGHVGFVAGASPLRPRFWAERSAARFVAAHAIAASGRAPATGPSTVSAG